MPLTVHICPVLLTRSYVPVDHESANNSIGYNAKCIRQNMQGTKTKCQEQNTSRMYSVISTMYIVKGTSIEF